MRRPATQPERAEGARPGHLVQGGVHTSVVPAEEGMWQGPSSGKGFRSRETDQNFRYVMRVLMVVERMVMAEAPAQG